MGSQSMRRSLFVAWSSFYYIKVVFATMNAATVELKTKRDIFPERRNGREGVNYGCVPFERV
jgi:hypothetical protein